MKIDHSSEIRSHIGPATDKVKPKDLDGANDFAGVLKKAVVKEQDNKSTVNALNRVVQPSAPEFELKHSVGHENTASHLLDTLEDYQRMLADPEANLKQVQPLVDQMKTKAVETAPLVETLPDGHAVKGVIEETLIQINKEIARFERGEYVDG